MYPFLSILSGYVYEFSILEGYVPELSIQADTYPNLVYLADTEDWRKKGRVLRRGRFTLKR